jgi:predicted Ser/Thr protein kinase
VLEALHSLLNIGYYNSSLSAIYPVLSEILVFARMDALKETLHDDARVKELLELIDFLPREYFERITPKLALLGETFIRRVNGLVGAGKIKLDERESNSLSYIYWKTGSNL